MAHEYVDGGSDRALRRMNGIEEHVGDHCPAETHAADAERRDQPEQVLVDGARD